MKIKNPDLSSRDIEKETWVDHSTVTRILDKELQHIATNDKAQELYTKNLEILSEGKRIITEEIKKIGKAWGVKITSVNDIRSLSSTLEDAFKQNQLLSGKPTDNVVVNELDEKQKELIAKRFLWTKSNNSFEK